mgnify:CR=1 FL=1
MQHMNTTTPCADCVDLGACRAGTGGVVTCVRRTQTNSATVRRLAELGVRPGATITAGSRTPGGGRVIGVAGAQLALDADTLRHLHVAAA